MRSVKPLFVLCILLTLIVAIACRTPKKVYYELPADMLESVKKDYAIICDKGRVLYEVNCAGCHTKKKWGKEIIPDFTAEQLEAYSIRATNPTHETRVTEEQVSAEELSYILTYLSYKTKSHVQLKSSAPKVDH